MALPASWRSGVVAGDRVVDGSEFRRQETMRWLLEVGGADLPRLLSPMGPAACSGERPAEETEVGPPVPDVQKVIAVGVYRGSHASASWSDPPTSVGLFAELSHCVMRHGFPVQIPAVATPVVHEGGLAVTIGRRSRNLSRTGAVVAVAGCALRNDIRGCDLKAATSRWTSGTIPGTCAALGSEITPRDDTRDVRGSERTTVPNGERSRHAGTSQMILAVVGPWYFISAPADPKRARITSPPGGVRMNRTLPLYTLPGHVVSVEIGDLARITNPVSAATAVTRPSSPNAGSSVRAPDQYRGTCLNLCQSTAKEDEMSHDHGQASKPQTLYDRLWSSHVVEQRLGHPALLYIDLHLLHEGSFLQAFTMLRDRGLPVRRTGLTVATTDHFVPSDVRPRHGPLFAMPYVVKGLLDAAEEYGIEVFGPNHPNQGIVHVIGPDLGLTLPGMTVVCGDSHTSTHGALGTLAFGIGTTQVGHVLASQCLLQVKQHSLRLTVSGRLGAGVVAKDLALHLLATYGVDFGRGHVVEYAGEAITALSLPERMSLCNMTIEMGARSGIIAPDDTTLEYVAGRPYAPAGAAWDRAVAAWRALRTDPEATFDCEIAVDGSKVVPMVTYGTTPGMAIPVTAEVPAAREGAGTEARQTHEKALAYMGMRPGERIAAKKVRMVFVGSCTNSRIEDLRAAARILRGRHVAAGTTLRVVPGSQRVKRQAEAEGLAAVFRDAGARWGEPGCSMCVGINGDIAEPGDYVASTSNRNFEGRQGPSARTLLMSPFTAAATAVAGVITDPRRYLNLEEGL